MIDSWCVCQDLTMVLFQAIGKEMLWLVCMICVYMGVYVCASIGVCVPVCLVVFIFSPTIKRRAIGQSLNESTGGSQI